MLLVVYPPHSRRKKRLGLNRTLPSSRRKETGNLLRERDLASLSSSSPPLRSESNSFYLIEAPLPSYSLLLSFHRDRQGHFNININTNLSYYSQVLITTQLNYSTTTISRALLTPATGTINDRRADAPHEQTKKQ